MQGCAVLCFLRIREVFQQRLKFPLIGTCFVHGHEVVHLPQQQQHVHRGHEGVADAACLIAWHAL